MTKTARGLTRSQVHWQLTELIVGSTHPLIHELAIHELGSSRGRSTPRGAPSRNYGAEHRLTPRQGGDVWLR